MHIIRLRKPWTRTSSKGVNERTDVPDLQESTVAEEVHYQRAFNSPTGLGDQTRVHLKIQRWDGALSRIELNGNAIAFQEDVQPLEIDITESLTSGNRLTLTLHSLPNEFAKLSGEVALVIVEN